MTAAELGDPARPPRSAPVAWISHGALRRNARALGLVGTVTLPADAYGHGFAQVARTLAEVDIAASETGDASPQAPALLGLVPGTEPVLRLEGSVLGVKPLRRGEGVSYGYTHRATRDTRIALVVGGYAQGVVRALGDRVDVTIAGARHRIVGRVAMDVCVVDVGAHPVTRGDAALLLGDARAGEPTILEWAAATGLGVLELVTAVGLRAIREHTP